MKRAIIFSLLVLLSVGMMLPLVTNLSEASKSKVTRKRKKIRKYSRAWWRLHRAKQRRQRAAANRRRALSARRAELAEKRRERISSNSVVAPIVPTSPAVESALSSAAPTGWTGRVAPDTGDAQFSVTDAASGTSLGTAQLSVVTAAMPTGNEEGLSEKVRKSNLGGVPVTTLRRTVIDRMIREEGWVVNDYQREVGGRRVFVVVAQTPAGGAVNSRLFYFTEVDGRIYSLSTNAPTDHSDRLATDSEKLLTSLHQQRSSTTQTASSQR